VSAPTVSCHLELDATPRLSAAEVDRLASVAAQLAGRVREERPEDVAAWLVDELPDQLGPRARRAGAGPGGRAGRGRAGRG